MKRVLLIEPDKVLADTYRQAMRSQGYEVAMANGAQAGVLAADEKRPDVIVLEIQLVGHSGIEFLYELRSYPEWQDIPVIIQSQVPPVEFQDSASLLKDELGVQAYLYKPHASLRQLLKELNDLVPAPA